MEMVAWGGDDCYREAVGGLSATEIPEPDVPPRCSVPTGALVPGVRCPVGASFAPRLILGLAQWLAAVAANFPGRDADKHPLQHPGSLFG